MKINWLDNEVYISRVGRYEWPKGMVSNPLWSRWIHGHQLRLCVGGRGSIHLREGKLALERGSCQWLRSGWDYVIVGDADHPLRFLTIRFDLRDSQGHLRKGSAELPPENLLGFDTNYLEGEIQRIVDDVIPDSSQGAIVKGGGGDSFSGVHRIRATARLTALLIEIDERTAHQEQKGPLRPLLARTGRLQRLADRISEDPGWMTNVEDLAREADYTPSHFCRAFKQQTGFSPQDFLINWRIHHARRMLVDTSLSVKVIAAELGYRSSEFFSRQFRAKTGLTPGAYREKNPSVMASF